jgi:hypothetical protein
MDAESHLQFKLSESLISRSLIIEEDCNYLLFRLLITTHQVFRFKYVIFSSFPQLIA